MVVEQALAVVRKRRDVAGEGVDAFGEREAMDFAAGEGAGIERLAAIDVGGPDDLEAVGREAAGVDLPLVGGDPGELLRGDVEQGYVVIAVGCVGRRCW